MNRPFSIWTASLFVAVLFSPLIAGIIIAPTEGITTQVVIGAGVAGFVIMAASVLSVRFRYSLQGESDGWYWSTWKKFPPTRLEKLSLLYGIFLATVGFACGIVMF